MQFLLRRIHSLEHAIVKAVAPLNAFSSSKQQTPKETFQKNEAMLQYELKHNPQFDNSFPQLKQKKDAHASDLKELETYEEELDFLESLSLKRRAAKNYTSEEIIEENFKQFEEGYKSSHAPQQWTDEEELKKVDLIADQKLEELESTGLSKEEILFEDGRKGIPLAEDSFFQFIKNNKKARRMLLSVGEEYTAQKIVALALRQDIGPDSSQSLSLQDGGGIQTKVTNQINIRSEPEPTDFDPKTYLAELASKPEQYINELIRPDERYHYRPITDYERAKRNKRVINNLDIHWRNTELLTEFLNLAGHIQSSRTTRLSQEQQRKVAKNIKIARSMYLLPYHGIIQSIHKRSLRTLQEDIEDCTFQSVNLETGHIYIKDRQDKFDSILGGDYTLSISEPNPNEEQKKFLEALKIAKKKKETELLKQGVDINLIKEPNQQNSRHANINTNKGNLLKKVIPANKNQPVLPVDSILPREREEQLLDLVSTSTEEQLKSSFEEVKQKFVPSRYDLFTEYLIAEKSLDIQRIQKIVDEHEAAEKEQLSVEESLNVFNTIRSEADLKPLKLEDFLVK